MDSHPVQLNQAASPPGLTVGAIVGVQPDALRDDLDAARDAGFTHVRYTVNWLEAQPRAGALDGGVVEAVRALADEARAAGMKVWLGLLSPDVPRWFDDEGGFTDDRTAGHWWPRWVETAADAFGDHVDGWVPFEAPFAMMQRLAPGDARKQGEVMATLTVAWRDAWRLLHGPHPVATSLDVKTVHIPTDDVVAADWARRDDQLRWRTWLRAMADGIVTIPGRADKELADMAGSCDQLGLALSGSGVGDLEGVLHRTAEQANDLPMAITYRPIGADRDARAEAVSDVLAATQRFASSLPIERITFTDAQAAANALR